MFAFGVVCEKKFFSHVLNIHVLYTALEFGVVNIGLFGSFAKGQPDKNSDIDLIVELREPRFDYLAGLHVYLEKKFSRKIEIVRKGILVNRRLIQHVEKDTIYA